MIFTQTDVTFHSPANTLQPLTSNFAHAHLSCFSETGLVTLLSSSNIAAEFISASLLQKLTLYKKLQIPTNLYYLIDAAQYHNSHETSLYFSFSTLLTDNHELLVISANTNSLQVPSLAKIFNSAVWLERELSDFTGLSFEGLTDTRGLLLDYLGVKTQPTPHTPTTNTYSAINYEVVYNY